MIMGVLSEGLNCFFEFWKQFHNEKKQEYGSIDLGHYRGG